MSDELFVIKPETTVKPTPERPLVTFALFAYNQEDYIEEAIEGAFAQTYEPLEIILSDDCSTDKTFKIISDIGKKYSGPHRVVAIRNDHNLGVFNHFWTRCKQAKGDFIVVAAADDVSHPRRVAEHIRHYRNKSTYAVTSAYDLIDNKGKILLRSVSKPLLSPSLHHNNYFFLSSPSDYVVIQGSTASYRKEVFSLQIPVIGKNVAEDTLMNFLIYANGGYVRFINDALISYRQHEFALSNRSLDESKTRNFEVLEHQELARNRRRFDTLAAYYWILDRCSAGGTINKEKIFIEKKYYEEKLNWEEKKIFNRSTSCLHSLVRLDLKLTVWKALRLLGSVSNYQPRKLVFNFKNFVERTFRKFNA